MRIFHPSEIRSLRKRIGLTQSELAEKAKISQAYIAKIEKGQADPKISTLEKISEALHEATSGERVTAEQVMERPIISTDPDEEISEAIKLMESNNISQMPVIENRKQVGSLSDETIIGKISGGENLFKLVKEKVGEIMTDPFPTVGPEADLDTIFHLLEHNQAVLVLKEGEPVGIVTKADILQLSMH